MAVLVRDIKLKGSTLIEVLIASVIILAVFTMATITILNIYKSSAVYQKAKAQILVANVFAEAAQTGKAETHSFEQLNLWIEKEVLPADNGQTIIVKAFNQDGRLLVEQRIKSGN
jgi:type II secretory pathway pseudopilin PulG